MRGILTFTLVAFSLLVGAQTERKVAVLDMTDYNKEAHLSRYHAVVQLLESSGIPYDIVNDIDDIDQYPVVIAASRVLTHYMWKAVARDFKRKLITYVKRGGVFIHSGLKDPALYEISGIDFHRTRRNLYRISWDTASVPQIFTLIDDSLEQVVSIGKPGKTNFHARTYALSDGQALGHYENGEVAMVQNAYHKGWVYTFGPDLRDVYMRNLTNFDISAQRTYSNGFEPSTDVFMFVVRNIVARHIPHTVFKHSSPGHSLSTILVTHDIDSRTGIDSMFYFSEYERDHDIPATYNITTRYFRDGWMSNFYVKPGSFEKILEVVTDGHRLASHSVGHFRDFHKEENFPYALNGSDTSDYNPYYTQGKTSGGSLLSELVVSKKLLEQDFGATIQSFRAGHLLYPDSLVMALEEAGYQFNTTYSANTVMTGYPYRPFRVRTFSGTPSGIILEIPMTLSDVFKSDKISAENAVDKGLLWSDITLRYHRNFAPVTLLIHPNRGYKLNAFSTFYQSVKDVDGLWFYDFESYGNFWKERESTEFYTEWDEKDKRLTVHITAALSPRVSYWIDDKQVQEVVFKDQDGQSVQDFNAGISRNGYTLYSHKDGGMKMKDPPTAANVLSAAETMSGDDGRIPKPHKAAGLSPNAFGNHIRNREQMVSVYPNPISTTLHLELPVEGLWKLQITDHLGQLITQHEKYHENLYYNVDFVALNQPPGMYYLRLEAPDGRPETHCIIFMPD